MNVGGWWGIPTGNTWAVTTLPCRLTPSPSPTTLTKFPSFAGGYIIDHLGGTWVALDTASPSDWEWLQGDRHAGTGSGLVRTRRCLVAVGTWPKRHRLQHPYAMAFCDSNVYAFRPDEGFWQRWQGPTVYPWERVNGVPCGLDGSPSPAAARRRHHHSRLQRRVKLRHLGRRFLRRPRSRMGKGPCGRSPATRILLRNGVDSFGRAPQLSLRLVNGVLTLSAFAFTQQWYPWIGGTWVLVGPDRTGFGIVAAPAAATTTTTQPPPTQGQASPPGTTVPPASSITDGEGAVWTIIGNGVLLRNGVDSSRARATTQPAAGQWGADAVGVRVHAAVVQLDRRDVGVRRAE